MPLANRPRMHRGAALGALLVAGLPRIAWALDPTLPPPPPPPAEAQTSVSDADVELPAPPAPPPGLEIVVSAGESEPVDEGSSQVAFSPTDVPEPPGGTVRDRAAPRRSYAKHTLVVDAAALGAVLLGAASDEGAMLGLGAAAYFFGAPIVHVAHRQGGRAWASIGLRVGLPLGGVLAGMVLACGGDVAGDCAVGGAAVGGLLGVAGAVTLDASVLARKPLPARKAGVAVTPQVDRSFAGVHVHGTF